MDKSLKLASGELPDEHNTRIILVDRKGFVRGFYKGLDTEAMGELKRDLTFLARS